MVKTVKRAPAPQPQPTSNLSSLSQPRNALSEEYRKRIEDDRRERERKRAEAEEGARRRAKDEERLKRKRAAASEASGEGSKKKTKAKRAAESDEDEDLEDDAPFAPSSSARSPSKRRGGGVARVTSSPGDGYKKLGRSGVEPYYLVPRDVMDEISFSSEELPLPGPIQSAELVAKSKGYGAFFQGLTDDAQVTLEYPAQGASETFSLLVPKDPDEYDPISDLLRTVAVIVGHYLTTEQKELFGSLDSLEVGSAAGNLLNRVRSREGSTVTPSSPSEGGDSHVHPNQAFSRDSTPSGISATLLPSAPMSPVAKSAIMASATAVASSAASGMPSVSVSAPATAAASPMVNTASSTSSSSSAGEDSILRSFTKARNRRDGPLFVRTVERFNAALRSLKESDKIKETVSSWAQRGISEAVWRWIQEQCYARTVGPKVEDLAKYEAFSDNVYGELLPRFMSEIAQLTSLGPNSVFVDLGSGVGNLVMQVALQTGAHAVGCEQMASPSHLAKLQLEEARARWKVWGVKGGEMDAWQGDFGEDERIRGKLREADVVLVNK